MKSKIEITPNRSIGVEQPCFIIAEIGQNHNGNIETAKQLIREAKNAGADCVKFQKSNLEAKFTRAALLRPYNSPNSFGATYGEHKQFLEFTVEQHKELQRFARDEVGVIYSASAMDEVSYRELKDDLKFPFIKIGSGDANNYPMLKRAAQDNSPPLIISTGMQSGTGIDKIVEIFRGKGQSGRVALLHCVSSYPTEPKDCRLRFIEKMQKSYPEFVIGYSGHESTSTVITLGAVALGAHVIERHVTLDKSQKGSDHSCSLTPDELRRLCRLIRNVEKMNFADKSTGAIVDQLQGLFDQEDDSALLVNELSDLKEALASVEDERKLFNCELSCYDKLGKTLVYRKYLKSGSKIQETDLCVKVSDTKGLNPEEIDQIIGKSLLRDVMEDAPVLSTDFTE